MANSNRRGWLQPLVEWILMCLTWCSLYRNIFRLMRRIGKWSDEELIPFWFAETYVVSWLVLLVIGFSFTPVNSCLWLVFSVLAGYRLFDLGIGLASIPVSDFPRRRDAQGSYILVRNSIRWMILTVINLVEVVTYFSFAYLTWGTHFIPHIDSRIAAVHQSLTTFITLGWSRPSTNTAHIITIIQICYFILVLIIIVPFALSVFRTKEQTQEIFGRDVGEDGRR